MSNEDLARIVREAEADRRGARPLRWVARRPAWQGWGITAVVVVVAFLLGVGAGAGEDLSSDLEDARARAAAAEDKLAETSRELEAAQGELEQLTAEGEVPDFTGGTVEDAELVAGRFDWRIKNRGRSTDSAEQGTVIAQRPKEGTALKSGRSITLTVARKPPPKPREWVTIATFSSSGKTDEFEVPEGRVRLRYDMPGSDNNVLTLYQSPEEYVDLLVNEIGATSGTTRLYQPGTYYLDIEGAGTIEVQHFTRP